MPANFKMESRKSNGNLHINLKGDFDGNAAWELIRYIEARYPGKGQIFINTKNLRRVNPFGCSICRCHIGHLGVPADCIIFKGENGFEMAPKGSKILVLPEEKRCRCQGNCENCKCSGSRKKSQNN